MSLVDQMRCITTIFAKFFRNNAHLYITKEDANIIVNRLEDKYPLGIIHLQDHGVDLNDLMDYLININRLREFHNDTTLIGSYCRTKAKADDAAVNVIVSRFKLAKSDLCSLSSDAWHNNRNVYFDKVTKDELSLDAAKKWARYEIKIFLRDPCNKAIVKKSLQFEKYLNENDIIILHNKMSNIEDTKDLLIKAKDNSSIVDGFNDISITALEQIIKVINCDLMVSPDNKILIIKLEAFKRVLNSITMKIGLHILESVNKK